ncbi:hypothetical protein LTR03_017802 [Friedmanniomyces endolithicus]|nr:hypothetical protein LTR03_017802 [Friedmanniomyces endolithicus]
MVIQQQPDEADVIEPGRSVQRCSNILVCGVDTNTVPPNTGREWGPPPSGWLNDANLAVDGESVIVDGAKRDRAVWAGDLGISIPSVLVSTGDLRSVNEALQVQYNHQRQCMPTLMYPGRDYIVQIASFEQSDGVADALVAYAAFRRDSRFYAHKTTEQPPQLVLCSPSSASSNSTDEMTGFHRAVTDRETLKELNESPAML